MYKIIIYNMDIYNNYRLDCELRIIENSINNNFYRKKSNNFDDLSYYTRQSNRKLYSELCKNNTILTYFNKFI